mmetsp:Transcript_29070/g.69631  ORF Transcript_29070/g.69631 Transcript_29070/m.69631 type:complete len:1030 (+) Transcript_29070:720-3809(+)
MKLIAEAKFEALAKAESDSLWAVAAHALALTGVDAASAVESAVVPALHADLIGLARSLLAVTTLSPAQDSAMTEVEQAESGLEAACSDLAESLGQESKGEEDSQLSSARDAALRVLNDRSEHLLEVCGEQHRASADARLREVQALLPQAEVIHSVLGGGLAKQTLEPNSDSGEVLSLFVQQYDAWISAQREKAHEGRTRIETCLSELGASLKQFAEVLSLRQPGAELPPTAELVQQLKSELLMQEWFLAGAVTQYAENVQEEVLAASMALVTKLKIEETAIMRMLALCKRAEKATAMGLDPHKPLLDELGSLQGKYADADDAFARAQFDLERLRKRRGRSEEDEAQAAESLAAARAELSTVRGDIRKAWAAVHALAAGPYPELPAHVLLQYPELLEGAYYGDGGELFCPWTRLDQFHGLERVSVSEKGSRHNVWKAATMENSKEVVVALKEFDLGSSRGGAGKTQWRTMQREVNTLAKLKHPNVTAVESFFLQQDRSTDKLMCYVRFPWFPGGDFERWLETEEAKDLPKAHLLILDVLRGLEHVHYHDILHGDIKAANVLLTEVQANGLRRAVLADFDLSLDQQQRKEQMSLFFSMSMIPRGPRGTPGVLTLAPEVERGEPSTASDMYSFGGLALLALHRDVAQAWQGRKGDELWDAEGAPCVEGVPSLVRKLLDREPKERPTATEALADELFAAIGVAEKEKAGRVLAALVAEQRRFREAEAQLAGVVEVQMRELQQRGAALEAKAESISEQKKRQEEDIQQKRAALDRRAQNLADKEAIVAALVKSRVPPYWQHDGQGFHRIPNPSMKAALQDWIHRAVFRTHGHPCGDPMLRASVSKVERVENGALWHLYQTKKEVLRWELKEWKQQGLAVPSLQGKTKQPSLPSVQLAGELNEFFLFHGTSPEAASIITQHGFDERVAALTGLYGAGSYFADSSCKSHQYAAKTRTRAGEHILLLCRVTMGWAFATAAQHGQERRPPANPKVPNRPFDSIFAASGVGRSGEQEHNEYVVFDRHQAYPEYVIHYKV